MQSVGAPLNDWLARLETFSPQEIDLGLERVKSLLERLNLALPKTVFHIAGTNGKGSSVAMLESLLRQSDTRVGSYTSPHILRYNERIRINGSEATDAQITDAFDRIETRRDDLPLTYFEFGTLAAMVVFAAAQVDTAILEVGMGGRLDAVNAMEPDAGLITNVSLDHCEWLGNDVATIALEKAGIMRSHKPIVFASADIPRAIVTRAEEIDARLIAAGRDYSWSKDGERWSWQGVAHTLAGLRRPALRGDMQIENAAGVLALVEAVGLQDLLRTDIIDRAFAAVSLCGRMQSVATHDNWLLDVAHNPAAAVALANTLRAEPPSGRTVAVVGMLDDKNVEGVIAPLADVVDDWIAVSAESARAIPARELARRVANASNKSCLIAESLPAAMDRASELAAAEDRVLVTGSFYVVGPLLSALELYSPRQGKS